MKLKIAISVLSSADWIGRSENKARMTHNKEAFELLKLFSLWAECQEKLEEQGNSNPLRRKFDVEFPFNITNKEKNEFGVIQIMPLRYKYVIFIDSACWHEEKRDLF